MARPVESERKDIRALVLEKSRDLFDAEGYRNITMRRIAEEIGCAPGSIYLYFTSKEEILYELHNEGFKLLYEYKVRMLDSGVSDSLDRLRKGGRMYIAFALENPEYYEVMFNMPEPRAFLDRLAQADASEGPQARGDYAMRAYDFLREGIVQCIDEGYLPQVDADVAAFLFWSTVHGAASLAIRGRGPFPTAPAEDVAAGAVDLFMSLVESSRK